MLLPMDTSAERHLRLLPSLAYEPPVDRRKPWRPAKKRRRVHVANLAYLYAHEEDIILADLAARGGKAQVADLMNHAPMRYDKRRLEQALDGLCKFHGPLVRERADWDWRWVYSLRTPLEAAA